MHNVFLFLPLFAIGLFFLFSWKVALTLYAFIFAICSIAFWKAFQAQRQPPVTGRKTMVGAHAVVVRKEQNELEVSYQGEIWKAVSPQPLITGEEVIIEKVEGLTLHVLAFPHPPGKAGS